MNFKIIKARPEYAAKMVAYVKKVADETTFLTFTGDQFNKTEEEEAQIVQNYLENDRAIFLLALIEEEVVGMLNFITSHKPRLHHAGEFGISVVQEHWRKGIGSALLTHLIDWCRDGGLIRKINLLVSVENQRAIDLYIRLGFTIEGTISRDMYINGRFIDAHQMGMKID